MKFADHLTKIGNEIIDHHNYRDVKQFHKKAAPLIKGKTNLLNTHQGPLLSFDK